MSGGIDSFVTALLLRQQNYEVTGVVLDLWETADLSAIEEHCRRWHIPLLHREGQDCFRQKVVDPFVNAYRNGLTPSPCCNCNPLVKWKLLQEVADEAGIENIATGHYVRIEERQGRYYFRKGVDAQKDQSYFLWGVSQNVLKRALTPLGEYTKKQVKEWAMAHGYECLAKKPESMGVCFLKQKDYRDFIMAYSGEGNMQEKGEIVDRNGRLRGWHTGLLHYTVGQKRGIPSGEEGPLYVSEIDVRHNRIIVASKAELYTSVLWVEQINAVCLDELLGKDIEIKIRGVGLNPQGYIRAELLPDGRLKLILEDPAWAVAPGQPVAFYKKDLLLGGGIASKGA